MAIEKAERDRLNEEFKKRTRQFGLDVFELYKSIESTDAKFTFGKQLIRASSSVGANYRSACRARSRADFLNKLKIVEEEADEALYWLEFLVEGKVIASQAARPLIVEGNQILAMVVASITTTRAKPPSLSRQS